MGVLFGKVDQPHLKISFGRKNNPNRPYNKITTTKYSLLSFLPKSLILQFTRASNFVYLISAVLQSISIISSLSPITAIGPLLFVIIVALIRQGYEDYVNFTFYKQKRYTQDVQINQRVTMRLQNGIFNQVKWQKIKAGDIVKVRNNQVIPCDLVLLYSTEQNSISYVQTSNLDGQTNLKTKYAFVEEIFLYPDQFDLLSGYLEVQKPTADLYSFNGKIKLENHEQRNLVFQNLLLRQTHLKNTVQAVGIAVYCGSQSKIMKNKGHIQHKITNVQKKVNVIQFALFIILILLCAACSIGYYLFHKEIGREKFFYLKKVSLGIELQAGLIFFTCFLLLNFIIPISLNVLLQFIKAFLAGFLGFDNKFKDQFCPDGIHTGNMSIMQELGLVDYILTDKTGTLTANKMVFKSCCLQDKVYSRQKIQEKIQDLTQHNAFHNFWLAVVICHDVVKDDQTQKYQGASPDQVCFIQFAKNSLGYEFIKRTRNYIQLNIRGQKVVYQFLDIIPFSSRRRMSVIVRAMSDANQILIFTKGADSAIFQKSVLYKYQEKFQQNINNYALEGLRTLAFSYRKMSKKQFDWFQQQKKDIAFYKFNKTKSAEQIQEMQLSTIQQVQNDLIIIGATAIEDKLQDKVPQTIARLQQAGIKIMMITGDKLQTAQNIGHLANLIKKNFKIVHIRSNLQSVSQIIKQIVEQIQNVHDLKIGVIIQGTSIRKIVQEDSPQLLEIYVKLIKKATSIIFCRSSPKQKALIVKFVKQRLEGVVLAVGDGGNDIGMIQQANIGIGILGRQGNSAAAASDFYFGQFKHLDRLLLHHGRWFYMRISYFFVYYGWKNLMMTVIMFLFILRSAYSGFPAFSEFYITTYNLLIGMYIIGYYGVWQQDINDDIFPDVWHKLPFLYKDGKNRDLFSYQRYITWTLMGIGTAVVLDFYINLVFAEPYISVNQDGYPSTYDSLYLTKSVALVIITFVVVILDLKTFTWYTINIALILFTFAFLVIMYIVQNAVNFGRGYRSFIDNDTSRFWFVNLVVAGVALGVKLLINVGQVQFFPTQVDKILKEKHQKGQLSVQNLNPHINPKQLLMNIPSKIIPQQKKSSRGGSSQNKRKTKRRIDSQSRDKIEKTEYFNSEKQKEEQKSTKKLMAQQ